MFKHRTNGGATSESALSVISADAASVISGDGKPKHVRKKGCGLPFVSIIIILITLSVVCSVAAGVSLTIIFGNNKLKDATTKSAFNVVLGLKDVLLGELVATENMLTEQHILLETIHDVQTRDDAIVVSKHMLATVCAHKSISYITACAPTGLAIGAIRRSFGSSGETFAIFTQNENLTMTYQTPVLNLRTLELDTEHPDWGIPGNFSEMTQSVVTWSSNIYNLTTQWTPNIIPIETTEGVIPCIAVIGSLTGKNNQQIYNDVGWFVNQVGSILTGFDVPDDGLGFLVHLPTATFLASTSVELNAMQAQSTNIAAVNSTIIRETVADLMSIYGNWQNLARDEIIASHWLRNSKRLVLTTPIKRNGLSWALVVITDPQLQTVSPTVVGAVTAITAVIICIAAIISLTISAPLNRISKEMASIANLSFRHRRTSQDSFEVGDDIEKGMMSLVTSAFTSGRMSMASEVRELVDISGKLCMETWTLTKFVPRAVILELVKHQDIIDGIISNPMKKRDVVVAFIDLEGSTELCERITPEELTAILNQYFLRFGNVITRYDGVIDKYMGDGIMVVYGAPQRIANQEIKACLSALEFEKAMKEVRERMGQPNLKYRVGIHCGEALVGTIGCIDRFSWTICGSVPSIASRAEKLGKKYHITPIITDPVVKKLNGLFNCVLIDIICMRGSSHLFGVYHLRSEVKQTSVNDIKILNGFKDLHDTMRIGDTAKTIQLMEEMEANEIFAMYIGVFARLKSHNFIQPEAYAAIDVTM